MAKNIFSRSYERLSVGTSEFQRFKELALPKIKVLTERTPRFKELDEHFTFYVDEPEPRKEALQLWFGNRSMFRQDTEGKVPAEKGAALLYTLGPTGDVAVILYPATSSLSKPFEEHIYLRIGYYNANQLFIRLRRDILDLVAYSYVSSLDAEATIGERVRIWWLRNTHPMQIKGEFTAPRLFRYARPAFEFTMRTMLMVLLKPLAIIVVVVLLIYFGAPQLAKFLKP